MKKKIFKYALAFVMMGAMTGLQSCEDYFDLNENPNLVTNPPLNAMLSTVTHKAGLNTFRVASITSYLAQHLANPTAGGSTDTYQPTDYTGTWDNLYYAMADIYDMKQKAIEEGASDYVGVANVLMAYHLSLVTDLFGDAPYSEAFVSSTLTPGYDSQEELYAESLRLLDEAIVELSKTDSRVVLDAENDLIHGGNKANWIKTAYAFKARFLNKVSKTPAYDPQAVLAAVANSYTSSADNAQMSVFIGRNPWAAIALSNENALLGGWLSSQLVEHLDGTTYGIVDPRIHQITDSTIHNEYRGTINGAGNAPPAGSTVRDESYISRSSPVTGDLSPIVIISYDEVKFIEAEAALRAGDQARAYAAYLEGIRANMDMLEVPPTDRDAYLSNPAVAVGAANLTLDLIFKEKYVVTYLNPEAWNDARRHDYQYAGFTMPVGAVLDTFIRRLAYPSGENSENGANVPEVASLAERLWWDQ